MPSSWRLPRRPSLAVVICLILVGGAEVAAEDWPEWRGHGRRGIWNDTGIVDRFPDGGVPLTWRTPVNAGYSGPAVAGGRVFVTDARRTTGNRMIESGSRATRCSTAVSSRYGRRSPEMLGRTNHSRSSCRDTRISGRPASCLRVAVRRLSS